MIPIKNTFEVETHPGVTIVNPDIELVTTVDVSRWETFQPTVIIHAENIKIYHVLPPQPYVNGTWEDDDVNNAITTYFTNL
jgi:hypothetical protein